LFIKCNDNLLNTKQSLIKYVYVRDLLYIRR
jgi:hypothetical protein